jgi:phenylpyruvate tautomerase PptA (4-oxalocrotonate tautomerase family)
MASVVDDPAAQFRTGTTWGRAVRNNPAILTFICHNILTASREETAVPLVRIDVQEGRSPDQLRRLADVVQEVMLEVFDAPDRDRYQIITVHPAGHIIAEDTNLGFERTADLVILQIFQQGRTDEHKKAAYAKLAERLEAEVGLRPTDLIVSVVANERADWSFGLGRAQFLEGDL